MPASAALVGTWPIGASGISPRDHLDLCGPAFLHIDLRDDAWLESQIAYRNGGGTSFIPEPWRFSATC